MSLITDACQDYSTFWQIWLIAIPLHERKLFNIEQFLQSEHNKLYIGTLKAKLKSENSSQKTQGKTLLGKNEFENQDEPNL